MPKLDFKTTTEFIDAFYNLTEANPEWSADEVYEEMLKNGASINGIKILDKGGFKFKAEDEEKINEILNGTYTDNRDLVEGEEGYEEQQENKKKEAEQNMTFSEYAQQDDWNKKNNWDKIQDVVGKYETILMDLKKLVDDNNSGDGLSDEALAEYKKEVENKKQQLRDIEQSKELYKLMEDVANRGTGKFLTDTGLLSPKTGAILDLMTGGDYSGGYGSELFSDTDAFKNGADYLTNSWFDNAGYATFNSTTTPQDIARSFILKGGNKEAANKGNKEGDNKEIKSDTKSNNKSNISVNGPFKPMNPTNENITDEMAFGSGVKGAGGNKYLEERNKSLAAHLKMKGIETPEEIDAYLSKYPSWKEAKQERKDNTLNILTEKMATMKGPEIKIIGTKEEAKDETKDETKKEKGENRDVNEDKGRLNKRLEEDKGTKASTRDVKDEKRLGDDWQPDNDSSINGIDEGENNQLRVKQYLDKGYKVKNGKFYTPSGVLVEQNGNNLSDKGEWVPANKSKDKLETADDWNDFWNSDNDSPINGTEDLKTEKDWNDFWNDDQKNETKKQTVKRPEKLNVKSAKKETKKEDKKENKKVSMKDIVKVVKSSPTIKNLLKNSKK